MPSAGCPPLFYDRRLALTGTETPRCSVKPLELRRYIRAFIEPW